MDCKINVYKRAGDTSVIQEPIEIRKTIMSINIDRRLNNVGQADVVLDNTKNLYEFKNDDSEDIAIIDNGNMIRIYINDKTQFTGIIRSYDYNEDNNTVSFTALDFSYRLTKNIDPVSSAYLIYENMPISEVITELIHHARINDIIINDSILAKDYTIQKMKVEYNTVYGDVLEKLLNPLYARYRCNKDGVIVIEDAYPPYNSGDSEGDYTWKFDTSKNASSGDYKRDTTGLVNRLIVRAGNEYSIFECPYLKKYLNGEIFLNEIQEDLAYTNELRKNAASKYFREIMRKAKTFNTVPVSGNPDLEIGDVVRINYPNNKIEGSSLLTGYSTSISDEGYTNNIETDILVDDAFIFGEEAAGTYIKDT